MQSFIKKQHSQMCGLTQALITHRESLAAKARVLQRERKCSVNVPTDLTNEMFLTFTLVHTPPLGSHHLRVLTLKVLVASASGKQIPAMTV